MRRHDPLVVVGLALACTVARLAAVVGLRPYRYVDSSDYESLDFFGGRRPWLTPLLHELVQEDRRRVVLHAALGAGAWLFAALEVGALLRDDRLRRIAVGAVLLLSFTTSVTGWDDAILSESLAISAGALLVGALLRYARRKTAPSAAVAVLAALLFSAARQSHLVLVLALAATSVVVAVVATVAARRRASRRSPWLPLAFAGAQLGVAALCVASAQASPEVAEFNTAMVIGRRLLADEAAMAWLDDHGMPPLPDGAVVGRSVPPELLLDDDRFRRWLESDGVGVYSRYLLAHPVAAVIDPIDDLVTGRRAFADPPRFDETMLSPADAYAPARQLVPEPLEVLLFHPGRTGTIVGALVLVVGATADRWRRDGPDERWLVPLLLIAAQWPALTVIWHASTAELGRLSIVPALVLRLGLITQLALLADAWLRERGGSVHVGREAVGGAGAEVDDGVGEGDGDGGGPDDDREPVAERPLA